MVNEETIVLCIGGFNIKVNFKPSLLLYEKDIFVKNLKFHYRNFLSTFDKKHRIHYTINIFEERHFRILKRKHIYYVSFYVKNKSCVNTFYHISLSQFTLIVIMILQALLKKTGFILHASGVVISGRAFLFTGPSDSGKSTIARILSSAYRQIADDSIIIRKESKEFFAYQTPLIEKNTHLFQSGKGKYPIGGIFFLKKTKGRVVCHIVKNQTNALVKLSSQLWVGKQFKSQISILIKLIRSNVNLYTLSFPKDERIVNFFKKYQQDLASHPSGTQQPSQPERH